MILLIYLFKLVACTMLFYGYYFLFLRNKQLHQFNRFYILLSLMLSIILPLIKMPVLLSGSDNHLLSKTLNGIAFSGWQANIILTADTGLLHKIISAQNTILSVYIAGVLLAVYPIIRSLAYIYSLAKNIKVKALDNMLIYNTTEPGTPFSFFNIVFWNSSISIDTCEGQQILRHELYHVREKHSYDVFFFQIANALLWFNPFCYLLNRELKAVHEFLADEYAASGTDRHQYAELLVMQAISSKQIVISNQFFYNQIKRRITMILQNNTTRYSYVRKLMAVPIVLLMFLACSTKSKDETMLSPTQTESTLTKKATVDNDAIFTKVEIESSFPGGQEPWIAYLNKNFVYPTEAIDKGIQGTVLVKFIVEKDGSLTDIQSIKGEEVLSKEAIRMITQGGKWEPARQNGKVVRSYKIQPITFRLQEK